MLQYMESNAYYQSQPMMLQIQDRETNEIKFVEISDVPGLNDVIRSGFSRDIVNAFETRQEWTIGYIAYQIMKRGSDVKVVMVAGPSSSGKTTFSKRLSLHLLVLGYKPFPISLDDYFISRDKTPLDEYGEKDYESIDALNVELFQQNVREFMAGREVELPRYDFLSGQSLMSGRKLRYEPGMVLVIEGIHGLNPRMTDMLARENVYKIYASSLKRYKIDEERYVPRTDHRLIRRLIRDGKYRGKTAKDTISMWPSVRRGEEKWIFPFQKEADTEFCSTQLYELAILRNEALAALAAVRPSDKEFGKAQELIDMLACYEPIDQRYVPQTSLLREFLGGSNFHY
ncbi:MAG: nucleoside kinase [Bacteroidaceae bacterium]|nr:nucleoside kinase [Bacteroidaceae bacterium]